MDNWIIGATLAGILGILLALFLTFWVSKQDAGTNRMKEISEIGRASCRERV